MDLKLKCSTFRVDCRLSMFENKVLKKIFGSETDNVTGELCDVYSLRIVIWVSKSRRMRWVRDVACGQERRDMYIVLVEKPEGKRPLEE